MIAVTGAGGQLGTAFRSLLGDEACYLTRAELDLGNLDQIPEVITSLRPSLLVNCAAYTAVDRAEEEPEQARAVNALAVEALADAANRAGARLVTFSTDYVFDGRASEPYVESAPTHPLSVYGATKREGEQLALAMNPAVLVVRTSWILSGTHPNFAATMLRLIRRGEARVVDDQRGHPTLAADLVVAVMAAVASDAVGILHLTNQGVVSWFELARRIARIAGLDEERVFPCRTADYPRPAARPANSVLASERLDDLGLEPMPHFDAGLEAAVGRLLTAGR